MKRAMVVGLVMLLVVGGLGMFAFPAAAAEAPLNLRVANRTDSSFTLSWTTENDTTGYVMILGSNYYDVRDPAGGPASYTGTTHYVEVDGLSETTAYTITVYSDGVAYSGGDLPFSSVTTLAVAPTPPPSYQVFGTIYEAEAPPGPEAVNTIVYLESPASAFEPLSFFTQSGGDYMFNLGNIRNSDGSFHYTGAALNTRIVAEGGNKGNAANTQTLGIAGSPEEIVDISLVVVDLYVDTFAPADAEMGIPCTITAWVRNSRPYATTVNVTFYEEDGVSSPDYVVIGWDEVTAVSSSSSKQASLTHTFTQVDSSHNIKVVVRPLDMVEEDNSDNTGYHILPVRGPDAPDLSVMDDDISFSPSSPDVGDLVDITVSVYNVGTLDGTCKVTASAGAWTKTVTSVNIPDGSYRDVVLQNWPIPSGESTVFVELTDASPSENNLENNFANATISPREPDLSIEAVDISFSLEPVREEEEFTVTVTVRNDGVVSGKCNVEIRFGSQSGTIKDDMGSTGFISPGSYKTMTSAPINSTTSGSIKVYAVLSDFDPSDSNPDNDYDYKIQVVTAVDPDLEMISVWGPNPVQDDDPNIKFIANFTNVGEMSIGVAEITFWNGHPDFGGTQIGGSKQSFFLDTGVTKSVTSDAWNATGLEGEYNIVARGEVIDPAGEETDFDNNMGVMVLTVIRAEPDLEVKVFVQDEVYEDDPDIDIYANVTNLGEQTVVSGNLTFWDGDPDDGGVQIDDVIVFSNLEYGMSINLSATWNVSGLAGTHDIYATVVSIFPSLEPDLTNNKAYDTIEVLASDPDMEITTITGPSIVPEDDDNITFDATFANIGLVNADLVTITFWDGDPDDGGVQIGNSTNEFNLIAGGASKTVTSDAWDATDKAGTHKIYAKVEVVNPPGEESIFDNNKDYMNVTVLSVEADIEATLVIVPSEVYEDDPNIAISALITNVGSQNIVSGEVTFWDGAPGGIQIGDPVALGSLAPSLDKIIHATLDWDANGLVGTHQIYVQIIVTDPADEIDTANNEAYTTVRVLASEPDIYVVQITGPSSVLEDEENIKFTATVTNLGQVAVDLASITFWDGHPDTGTQIPGVFFVTGLDTGVSKEVTSGVWEAAGLVGTHNIFAKAEVLNPAGEETELDNNLAAMSVTVLSVEADIEATEVIVPDEVYEGDSIVLAAEITNVGQQNIVSGSGTFWDGDPDGAGVQIGGVVPFTNLASGQSRTLYATGSWNAGPVGIHQMYFKVVVTDPVEPDTTNNKAHATIDVLASEPDAKLVEITGPSVVLENEENIIFTANVTNIGRKTVDLASITFWDGHPDTGTQIGSIQYVTGLDTGVSKDVTSDEWDATGLAGTHNIFAKVEVLNPAGEETELDNNLAVTGVTVLSVEADIEATNVIAPDEVYEDDDGIVFAALITNVGQQTIVSGSGTFWDGDPDGAGIQIGAAVPFSNLDPSLDRTLYATISWNANGLIGTHQIYFKVVVTDPVGEPDTTNNKVYSVVKVLVSEPDAEATMITGPAEVFEDDSDITFTTTVTNVGQKTVDLASITFWDGHPSTGTQIGSIKYVAGLGTGVSKVATSDVWDATGLAGTHNIFAEVEVVNPAGEETNFDNNIAVMSVKVISAEPDMEVTMVIAPDEVYEDDDNIDLAALIMNVGQQTVVSGSVTFWDGDPDIAGVQIGGAVPFSNLDYEESTTINATVSWDATGLVGTHQIYVQIIVTDPVGEPVTTNNKDYATVKVLASEPDVKVTPITGPSPVQEDDDNIRFNATVINIGRKDAAVVNITFWNGHPDFGGIQIGATKQIFNLLAGGVSKEVTSDAWDATGLEGDYNIRAIAEVVDPAGEETEVSNNMADMFVTVLAVEPDLEVTEVIAPVEVYEDDDNILISADVTNIGLETVVLGEVSFWDGNPDTTGVQIGAAVQFSDLVSGESRIFDATENYNANGKVGTHQIYVRVVSIDPAVEPVMTNNKAHAPMEVLSSEPDLEVTNVDGPAEVFEDDDDIVFTATVTNIDRRTVVEANITFWVGHPDTGTQIGVTKKVYNLALGESVNVLSDAWNAFGLRNTHEIWVDIEVLDPVENETGNNRLALSPYVLVKERPPYVVQSTPADAQINIDVTTSMNITFSKFMNTPDTEGAFTMIREGVTPVSGTFTWYAGGTILVFNPTNDMAYETSYTVTVTSNPPGAGAKDENGTYLDGDGNKIEGGAFSFTFTTEREPDTQGPITTNLDVTPDPTGSANFVSLTATIDDTTTGDRIIDAAHYCFGTVSTPDNNWVSMSFVDGQRDSSIENVEATVAVHSLAEGVRYYLWVRGQDEEGNEGTPVPISFYKTDLAEPTDENDNAWAGIQGLVDNGIGGELEASWLAAKDASTPLTYHVFGTYDTTVSGTPIFYYGTYDDYYETFSGDGYAPGDLMTVTLEGMDNERKMYVVVWVKDSAATPNTAEGTAPPRSATATDETAPWFAGLTIVEDTENGESLILKWKTAEDANKESTGRFITYNIYYREMSEDRTWEIMDSMQYSSTGINVSLNHEIFGLDANVAYEFIVSAVDFFGNNDTNLVFVMGTPTDQVAPVFAGLESAENYLDTNMDGIGGSVLLEWTAAPEPPTQGIKYLVYRSENMGEWNEVPIETENDFYLFEGLTNDKTYYFKVWAKDKFDNTNYNNNTENAIPTDTQVPYFVFLDEWTVEDAETGGAVTLRWSQAFDNNTDPGTSSGWHFKIYRDGSLKTTIFFNAANFTYEWTDTGLYNGVAYSYYIHCRDNSSNYAQLSTETIVPTDQEDPVFAGIDPVVCPAGTEGVLRLDWTEAVDGDTAPDAEIFYDIYRRVAGTGTWTMIDTITGDELPYEDDGSGATKQVGILEIDETYEYKVSARDNAWNDMETPFVAGTVVDTLAPRWSEDFTATDTGTGKTVKLTWIEADDVSDPVKYNIYWDTNPLFVPGLLTLKEQLVSGTPVDGLLEFEVEGLANDIVYWFILLPVDDEGNEADPVTPVDAEPTDVAPPEFDGLWLAEDLGTYGEVRLKWNDSTDNTDPVEYLVYYSSEGDPFLSDFKMSTPGTEIDIAGLENGKNYHFGVRARDSAVPQNTDNNTFFISMVPSDTIKPTFDGLVSATNEGSGGAVTLSWAAAADDSTNYSQSIYYHVYISKMDDITVQDTGDSSSLLSTTTQTTYTVEIGLDNKPLENDKKYYFLVKAVDHSGNMDVNTVMKNATPEDILPPVFSGPKAAQDQKVGGTLKLTWNTATDDYGVTYKIFRSDDPDFYGGAIANETPIAEDLTGTYYLDEELHNGQTYYYYVWVTDDNDNTNQNMNMVSATVTDDEPPSFAGLRTITDREEGGELLLTWNVAVDSSTAPGDEGKITYKIFMDDSQSVQAVPDYEVGETSALSFLSDNLANGVTYWYIVKAYDGAGNPDTSRERAVSAVPTRPNDGPSIASDIIQAQPVDMVGTTKVTFRATYSDPDGDKPKDNSVKVIIEGPDGRRQELIMTSQATSSNPDYVVGVPYQRVGFQAIPGEHTYYFECMDNPEEKSNDPGIEYVSPSETFTVFSKNAAPTLTESSMTPISGDSTTLFTFSITYKDPDDDPPARMQVLINDVPHDMILITGGTDHTKASTYSFSTTLDAESYTYFFYAEDADGNSEQTSRRTFDVEEPDSDAGGGDISNFLANEYYGVTGFVWLVLLIIIIIGILAVAAMAGKKGGPAPPPAAVKSAAQEAPETPMEETIDCPTCGSKLMISSPERPVTIECPTCNSQLKIS